MDKNKSSKIGSSRSNISAANSTSNMSSRSNLSAPKGGVVKTVVLPHEDLNRLGVEGQLMAQFLQQQESLFQDTMSGYQKDRSVRLQEFDLKQRDYHDKLAEL